MGVSQGYCGLDCSKCPVYIVTLSGDEARKQELAQEWFSEQHPLTAADMHCEGCSSSGGKLLPFASGCEIRNCAVGARQESCAFCASFPCAKLEKQLENSPESRASLEERRRGLGLSSKQVLEAALQLLSATASMAVTSIDASGFPRTRALMKIQADGLRQIVFTTSNLSDKVAQLRQNDKVSVHVADYASFRALTLWGTMQILEDRASKQAVWQPGMEQYYPEGIDTPWLCVLRFTAMGGQYYQGRPYEVSIDNSDKDRQKAIE